MNIGLIGAENSHARHFLITINQEKRFPKHTITHIHAGDAPDTGAELAREFGLTLARTEDEVIAACDAVVVTYRKGSLHADPVLRALKAGKAVFNDKPFSTDPALAQEIADYALKHNLLICGGSNLKGVPGIADLKGKIGKGATLVISFAADPESTYDGYWFYGIHAAELCLTLCGTDYRDVAAFRTGNTVVSTVRFDDATCVLVTDPAIKKLHVALRSDESCTAQEIAMTYESVGPAELVGMLDSGKMPREPGFYAAASRLLSDIIRATAL